MAYNQSEAQRVFESARYDVHVRFYVFDPVGRKWLLLSAYENEDFFGGCDYGEDIDNPIMTLTAKLFLETQGRNLSPYIVNTLKVRRAVELRTAITYSGVSPTRENFRRCFSGIIDVCEVDSETNEITLQCSDRAAYFRDMFIENPDDRARVYGSRQGIRRERVMQKIMDHNRLNRYILWTPVPSESYVLPYVQKRTSVWEALQEHALQLGWDLRFRYFHNAKADPVAGDFVLTFQDPVRGKTKPDYSFSLSDYEKLEKLTVSLTDVRNAVSLTYYDSVERGKRTLGLTDVASIGEYGYRFMALQEDAASLIDTEPEAKRLLEAVLADVAYPKADTTLTRRYWPYADLGQLIALDPDYRVFVEPVEAAVTGYRHRLYSDDESTQMQLRTS